MSTEDFWPANLVEDLPVTPADILREQAALLGPKTKNIVLADVEARPMKTGGFELLFFLRVPALDDYRFDLFTLTHGIDLYPIQSSDGDLQNEDELKSYIGKKLSDEKTVKIIRLLVSQAKHDGNGRRKGFGGGGFGGGGGGEGLGF
jgi:hypothetical protein